MSDTYVDIDINSFVTAIVTTNLPGYIKLTAPPAEDLIKPLLSGTVLVEGATSQEIADSDTGLFKAKIAIAKMNLTDTTSKALNTLSHKRLTHLEKLVASIIALHVGTERKKIRKEADKRSKTHDYVRDEILSLADGVESEKSGTIEGIRVQANSDLDLLVDNPGIDAEIATIVDQAVVDIDTALTT